METLDRHASGLARFEAATSRVDKPWGYEHIYRSEAAVTPAEERQEEGLNHGNTRSSRKWARALRGRDFEGRQALGLRAHLRRHSGVLRKAAVRPRGRVAEPAAPPGQGRDDVRPQRPGALRDRRERRRARFGGRGAGN